MLQLGWAVVITAGPDQILLWNNLGHFERSQIDHFREADDSN
jgi:hypothetical protein